MRSLAIALAVAGCGGYPNPPETFCAMHPSSCSDGGSGSSTTASIGGTVTGLDGASGLVLQNNGGDDHGIVSDGAFVFATRVDIGSAYDVTVLVQPTNPSEMCTVTGAVGVANADVNNVAITCSAAAYTIGGVVFGLTGNLGLANNGTDQLANVTNGPFTFAMPVRSGQPYSVTSSMPSTCPVFGGTGTVGNANVTTVVVNCGSASGPYAIGGMVSGLNGTVTLKNNNNGDTVSISSNGSYAFPMLVPSAGAYNVTVMTQPAYPPAAQVCSVSNNTGQANGNIQNVNVTCTTSKFRVGGSSSGVTGTVVVQNNGADNTTLPIGTGIYGFPTTLLSGSTYAVTVAQKPPTLACSIANGAGTVKGGDVTNANITCMYADPGIQCASGYCSAGTQVCCDPFAAATCTTSGSCAALKAPCDDSSDCAGKICCATTDGGQTKILTWACSTTCSGDTLCDPNVGSPCPGGGSCKPWTQFPPYYRCQ